MGHNVQDHLPSADVIWDGSAPKHLGYGYHAGQVVSPTAFAESPRMVKADFADVLDVAEDPGKDETDWLNAHPTAVKNWLNGRSANERACFYLGCQVYRV